MSAPALNLLVFRNGAREVSGSSLKAALVRSLQNRGNTYHAGNVLDPLLRAGELECALCDSGAAPESSRRITDSLAAELVAGASLFNRNELLELLDGIAAPETLRVSVPEGFAYYALHPLAFADVLDKIAVKPNRVLVIGIRSIGTTLSAVTAAAFRARGVQAARTTVRPAGHPYNRCTVLDSEQAALVHREISAGAHFVVVDEGPGLSGSSFLSVAEALARTGVTADRITLICSHQPEIEQLRAENAAQRWRRFRSIAVSPEPRRPAAAQVWIGGGEWRRYMLTDESSWPASWMSFERLKYLSTDRVRPRLFKFYGFGHYGNEILQREEKIGAAGFGPMPAAEDQGFASYGFIDGRPMSATDVSESVLARLAAYCAFRGRSFAIDSAQWTPLQEMAEHNLQELRFELPVRLAVEKPVVPDARMQPHEWVLSRQGQMSKVDSGGHGDDHFFPGTSDIAWDLAGAIVEWRMNFRQTAAFVEMYRRASGDDPLLRLQDYIKAYTVFRCAYCLMAASAMQGTPEQSRLETAAAAYGAGLMQQNFALT